MARNTNKDPIDYIEARIRYYDRLIGSFHNNIKTQRLAARVSDDKLRHAIVGSEFRKAQFERALLVLQENKDFVLDDL